MKVLALDYGRARTGVAVSDPTGVLARPLTVIERVDTTAGRAQLDALLEREAPDHIVVGLPLTLRGDRGAQAQETERFITALRTRAGVPVTSFDERFTSVLAARDAPPDGADDDARAAAHLLTSYLARASGPGA